VQKALADKNQGYASLLSCPDQQDLFDVSCTSFIAAAGIS